MLNRIADDGTGGVVLVSNRGEGEKLGLLQKAEVEVLNDLMLMVLTECVQ